MPLTPATPHQEEVYIIDAVRTPIGRIRGGLRGVRPDDLLAVVIAEAVKRTGLNPERVDEVIAGCANQAGEDNRNVARMALLLAGLPHSVPGFTVNRLCASSLTAVNQAARLIRSGEAELVLAGGVESMTRAPLVVGKAADAYEGGNQTLYDSSLGWRFPNKRLEALFPLEAMGETAENLAEQMSISRADQDRYAFESHRKAVAAEAAHRFDDERVAVPVAAKKGEVLLFDRDEGPRADSSLEKLATLKPAFRKDGSVTAGNASTLNDGAACLVLASRSAADRLGKPPLGRWIGGQSAGVDPRIMGIGPVPAAKRLLLRHGLGLADLDLIELNEAFAAQALGVMRALDANEAVMERVNPNGGAIALGHPLGASGARILTTLLHELRRRGAKRGLAMLCVGVGQGEATLVEAIQ